jgi:hypothetical protein
MAMTHSATWHADGDLLAAYVTGSVDAISAASVEQHLTRCGSCRDAVRPLVSPQPLEQAWARVRDAVESPPLPLAVRLAQRCGLPEPTAVLLAAAASLRTAWLTGAFVALAFAAVATGLSEDLGLAPFLLIAPLVPVLGVATAYAGQHDPLETLVVTTPYGRTRLILTRTLAVLVSVLPFTAVLGLVLPGPTWLAVAWLGPALALVPVLLALASFVGPRTAASIVAIGWSGVVAFSVRGLPATWPVEATQQAVYLTLALVSVAVLAARSRGDRGIGALL